MEVRKLPEMKVVPGTTWIPSHDEFGTSFRCAVCGKDVFYKESVPEPCAHKSKCAPPARGKSYVHTSKEDPDAWLERVKGVRGE